MKPFTLFIFFYLFSHNGLASTAEFVLCFDFGCKSTKELSFDSQQWKNITEIFVRPALSPWLEKQQIRQAIALMESFSGQLSGTHQDKAGNYPGEDLPFQQDCIDESTNTYQYLHALQQRELLVWHKVDGKKRRIVWFATHWSAVISENLSNELFAVDSWYRDNGEPPYIQPIKEWQRKASFSDSFNP